MINIEVKVKLPWNTTEIDQISSYPEGTSVEKVLEDLGLDINDNGNYLIIVNDKIELKEYILKDKDRLAIMPALVGG